MFSNEHEIKTSGSIAHRITRASKTTFKFRYIESLKEHRCYIYLLSITVDYLNGYINVIEYIHTHVSCHITKYLSQTIHFLYINKVMWAVDGYSHA